MIMAAVSLRPGVLSPIRSRSLKAGRRAAGVIVGVNRSLVNRTDSRPASVNMLRTSCAEKWRSSKWTFTPNLVFRYLNQGQKRFGKSTTTRPPGFTTRRAWRSAASGSGTYRMHENDTSPS